MSGRTYIKLRDRTTQPEDREKSIKRLVDLAMEDADKLALHLSMLRDLMPNEKWITDCFGSIDDLTGGLKELIPNE